MSDGSKHSKRSPSGADWWGSCPGGPAYCEELGLTREGGPAAQWGTMVHKIAEKAVLYTMKRSTEEPVFPAGDKPAKEVVEFYVHQLFVGTEKAPLLCDCSPKTWVIGVESKSSYKHLPDSDGTKDFVAHCPVHGWLRVVDLKTGHGEVEAEGNQQGAIYALQELFSRKYKVRSVVIEIIQPRSPSGRKVKRWTLTPFELFEMLPGIRRKVQASLAPNAPLIAGDKQCKYCPAAAVCPERKKLLVQVARLQFGVGRKYTPEDVAEALDKRAEVRAWLNSVDVAAYQLANNGMKIPGYKLVQSRDGNREWKDEEETRRSLLNEYGMASDVTFEPAKLKSPADIQEILEQVTKTKKQAKEVVDELCKREPGGTVLVEESDKRPAIVQDKLATFRHLLKPTNQET